MGEPNANGKQTWTERERKDRIEKLKTELRNKKSMLKDELYRFALTEFGVSIRVIDEYLKELAFLKLIEIKITEDTYQELIVWKDE